MLQITKSPDRQITRFAIYGSMSAICAVTLTCAQNNRHLIDDKGQTFVPPKN